MYQKVFFTWVGSVAEETHGDHMEIPLGYAGVSQTNANYPSENFFVALFLQPSNHSDLLSMPAVHFKGAKNSSQFPVAGKFPPWAISLLLAGSLKKP